MARIIRAVKDDPIEFPVTSLGSSDTNEIRNRLETLPIAELRIRDRGVAEYIDLWRGMRQWTERREPLRADQCWLASHPSVFTTGRRFDEADLLKNPRTVPLVHSDRGGRITYHGPGQPLFYLLLDLQRRRIGVRTLIWAVEETVIRFLVGLRIRSHRRPGRPGVYIKDAKIASLGFRVRRGCCYHGMSFNHRPDLSFFDCLHTCGYEDLEVTSLERQGVDLSEREVQLGMLTQLGRLLCYNMISDDMPL